jgi:spermidine/putrescine transport system ATP-binding protein
VALVPLASRSRKREGLAMVPPSLQPAAGPSETPRIAVEARNASKAFGQGDALTRALDDVSIAIRKGEFFTLLGPSGCGKTTLLRLIAGFDTPTSGSILLNGRDITADPPNRRPVNTVFQSYALFPHLTVLQNIRFGLDMLGRKRAEADARALEMLALVRLEEFATRRTAQLSGGQQQRVALARALAPEPEVLLLDEPLSALDLKLRKEMQRELKRLQRETGITFVFVTHDQEEALTMSDRIGVMQGGRILQIGPPREIYNQPANRFVADFIGETNFLDGEVGAIAGDTATIELAAGSVTVRSAGLDRGQKVTLAIRPEQVRIGEAEGLPALVTGNVYFGTDTHCHLELSGGAGVVARLQSAADDATPLGEGTAVRVSFTPGSVQVLAD